MKIMTIGIDLAKNVFAVHGIDEHGKAVLVRPSVRREQLLELVATLTPCVIGMEACSGAHHWARAFARLRPHPQTDGAQSCRALPHGRPSRQERCRRCRCDSREAVQRPSMRFVPIKSLDQQGTLCIHRVRQGFVEEVSAAPSTASAGS